MLRFFRGVVPKPKEGDTLHTSFGRKARYLAVAAVIVVGAGACASDDDESGSGSGTTQAGGAASTGRGRILEVLPTSLHQRVPLILGSRDEVARIEGYHRDHDAGIEPPSAQPLFQERSLFTRA